MIPKLDLALVKFNLCFIESDDKVLMLLRKKWPNDNLWNGVGGKIEKGESILRSAQREINEETGLGLEKNNLDYLGLVTWSYDQVGYNAENLVGGMHVIRGKWDGELWSEDVDSREGKLAWKDKNWVWDKENKEVVENIPIFLPKMWQGNLDKNSLMRHHFVYVADNEYSTCEVEELTDKKLAGEIFKVLI
jgi:8-oxo-dGTP diphosphatase